MKRKEEINIAAKNKYPYIKGLPQSSSHQAIFIEGAEYGYNLAIEQAVNWLCMNMIDTLYFGCGTKQTMSKPELINNLKQAMKL